MLPRRDGYSYALGRPIGADRDFLAQGRRRHKIETMHLIHPSQNWLFLSDPTMEEALYETDDHKRPALAEAV